LAFQNCASPNSKERWSPGCNPPLKPTYICRQVTLEEIQTGIELTREQDPAKAAEIETWADLLSAS
jgi:hypothetical protein